MKKRYLLVSLTVLLVFIGCIFSVSCGIAENNTTTPQTNSTQEKINITKSELTLSEEDRLSLMKDSLIRESEEHPEEEEVVIMTQLAGDAIIDHYNSSAYKIYDSVAEYAASSKGEAVATALAKKQADLISDLFAKDLITSVEHTYNTIINAVAVRTTYGKLADIADLTNVSSVIISETYNRPMSEDGDETSAIENLVDVYKTGIFNSSSVEYTGKGTAVAILDSGFDCSHSVFSLQPDSPLISQKSVSDILSKTKASKTTKNLELSDVYYSRKIPFVYDYADKDPDVFPYDSEHGTHVAGIIGGYNDVITGVAINTQLVLMKVFPDLDSGADTDDILAALEDAVLLEVDAINMSLGSSCGFAREEDGNIINTVYDKINASGISLLAAASNSYSSGYGGAQGNTNMVTNPDSGTIGSPSTYAAALSVASISGTKSKYLFGNDEQVIFFNESNAITGDPNDFFLELGVTEGQDKTFEYVTIPGVGLKVNYSTVGDLTGKIALIKRGNNTFEEKAQLAKNAGAAACIIYNNIDGDILMSMGKSDHIPTISISKDDGTQLALKDRGTLRISYKYQAGPFMSDFSSWGPSPSLELKPDITAHGGNIMSSVPGGGYDELSGTSMATPNLCGIVVLIRQYLKDKFAGQELSNKEISVMANQLLMSTATIVLNEEGNPYSPRKQGAGLASLYKAVNTKAYLSVDNGDRSKLELFDDAERSGVYVMEFNIENISEANLTYDLSLVGMTESVSTSDDTHVAEKAQLLNGIYTIESEGKNADNSVTVTANSTLKVKLTYTLTDADKALIDSLFPYGMYVEGFVKLSAHDEEIDMNIPFLAFYGDWTEAPLFDKTYYEVETQAHDKAIDDEDKLKADYFATTPYGSYYYNYIIPLGTYLYDVDESTYDAIPATEEHIAISDTLGTIDGISSVYAGLLRNAKTMTFTITDKLTGEVVYEFVDYNANKAFSYGGSPVPYYEYLRLSSYRLGLMNNHQYEFKMVGLLDYGDGGISSNVRNSFSFDFYLDNEAPVIKDTVYEKTYDKTLKKDRYYLTMTVYDNQYVQSITPILFTSSSSYAFLTENPIPVYSEKGKDNVVRFEITDYLEDLYADSLITNALAFSIDDYALNSNIYICQLPGTAGDFKFTRDGSMDGTGLSILSVYEGDVVDLTRYLATSDSSVDTNKDYLKYMTWTSSNEEIATAKDGLVKCLKTGRTSIVARELLNGKQAILIINVKTRPQNDDDLKDNSATIASNDSANIKSIRFSYFDTLFAYSRASQTSEIGDTGDRRFLSSMSSVSFYPGEKIQLAYDLDPWYVADKYKLSYSSTNPTVATVDEEGVVTALKKGSATIVLSVEGSNVIARVRLSVKSEFVIEDRTLIAYKGLGGEVIIPDDEGILYIGPYSFCLYDTDNTIELTDEDYDANKIPSMNTTITSVVIPKGVEDIQKYAFYNCIGLRSVTIPDTVKYIRECAFYNDGELTTIDFKNVQTIARAAFEDCKKLNNINLSKVYAIGANAFDGCEALESIDLTALRNAGNTAFQNCKSLKSVTLSENTKLSYAMFAQSGVTAIDIYQSATIPTFCFARCEQLERVTIHNDIVGIGMGAFSECTSLNNFQIKGKLEFIGEQAFYGSDAITEITLPNCQFTLGNYAFLMCSKLEKINFGENTFFSEIQGSIFQETALSEFTVAPTNPYYTTNDGLLLSKDGTKIIFAATGKEFGELELDGTYTEISDGAFAGVNIETLTINGDMIIGAYAFANCENLTEIHFPDEHTVTIGKHAFNTTEKLTTVENLNKITTVGEYAFANSAIQELVLADNATYGEGAFFNSKLVTVSIGESSVFGMGCFQNCTYLETVNMPDNGNVHFGEACFARDTSLAKIDLTKIDSVIEDETFYGCSKLRTADLLNVETVGDYAFADCSTLSYLNIPKVIKIGEGAFGRYDTYGGAPQISEVNLPDTLTTLGDGAFLGCEGLTEIIIPDSCLTMGDFLFSYCINLRSVTLPSSTTKVGQYSFAGCELLSSINLENIEEIADYAFTSTVSLTTIDLSHAKSIGFGSFASSAISCDINAPELETIGDYAFQYTDIRSLNTPALKKIGIAAFQSNRSLTEFIVPQTIELIEFMAFNGCSSMTSFYVMDSNKVANGKANDYAKVVGGVLYTTMESGFLQLNSIPQAMSVTTLEVEEGTYRIEYYAGNDNSNITKLILPDSLKSIGGYAFFGYKNLNTVEFRSFTAPALENTYNSSSELTEDDPGFELLHNAFDLFGFELCYYNFIDLVGKKKPIKMILPQNDGIEGYDSIVFEAYFGLVDDSERSEYVARDKNLVNFYNLATELSKIKIIALTDETLINNALAAYNATKQDPTDYGYTEEEWASLVQVVNEAKAALSQLKFANASQNVKDIQKLIDALPETFDIANIESLKALAASIDALLPKDRTLLNLSQYNLLMQDYTNYRNAIYSEIAFIKNGR